jgi:hypothetical protein
VPAVRSLTMAVLLLCLAARALGAQDPLTIPRLTSPVTLDGRIDESAWAEVQPLPMVVHSPTFGAEPSERTEVRVAHDGVYLYVAGRLYDADPSGIQAFSLQRDVMNLNNDYFGVVLDTFNDKENALTFFTTPAGVRTDFTIRNDANGDSPHNVNWNAFWDVEVSRDEHGWSAEFRIPFSSLGFQERDGEVRMGLITWRSIARKNEFIIYPAVPPSWGGWSKFKPSQAQEVVLRGARRARPLYVTPYLLGGGTRTHALNGGGTYYEPIDDPAREVGLDLKYGLTDNLTLDLTFNTDFAQVEADEPQVNLTRYSIFFPERRLFFQERASVFDFNTGGASRVFYSRRIGLHDGKVVPILGGARLVGRVGSWDVGAMSMQTAGTEGVESENFGVVRLRRRVLNPNSYAGGIVTSRVGREGERNVVLGVDGVVRLFGEDYLTMVWAQSFDERASVSAGFLDESRHLFLWQRRTIDGLRYDAAFSRAGPGFVPAAGFDRRRDYARYGTTLGYGWRMSDSAPVLRHAVSIAGALFTGVSESSVETVELTPSYQVEWKSGHTVSLATTGTYEKLTGPFAIAGDVEVPAGEYRFGVAALTYGMPSGSPRRVELTAELGSYFDGRRGSVSVAPSWSVSRHLELGGFYRFDRLEFGPRDEELNVHVGRLRSRVMLSRSFSLDGIVQYDSRLEAAVTNLRVRYNPREGRDLYLVYNAGVNTDPDRLLPSPPRIGDQTFLVKYSHTLTRTF